MAAVIVFANDKGGCAKTTSTGNIGVAPASPPVGKRVLLIDADPQANLSELFGCDDQSLPRVRLEDALARGPHAAALAPWTERPGADGVLEPIPGGVHLLPCTEELETVVSQGLHDDGFPLRLRELVDACRDEY